MENKSVYDNFIAWMKMSWYGLPDSEELLPAIKARYSEEEAALLTGMPFSPKNVRELAAQKGMDAAELSRALDGLAQKGLVFRMKKGGELFYGLNDGFLVFLRSSFWPGQMDEYSRRLAPRANAYFHAGLFDPYEGVRTRGLRAIPVETSLDIEAGKTILPYEDVAKVLEEQSEFCVAVCPYRHRRNLDPAAPDCKYSTENCLHFGTLARYMVENGLGRAITIQEARDILKQAAEEGLVHGISNWLTGVDTICNCCKCCCMWFESYHVLRHDKSMDASNFVVSAKGGNMQGLWSLCEALPDGGLVAAGISAGEEQEREGERPRGRPLHRLRGMRLQVPDRLTRAGQQGHGGGPSARPEGLREPFPHGMASPHQRRRSERVSSSAGQ